jgi:D-sedoheptulose 7-phosphate isomerase
MKGYPTYADSRAYMQQVAKLLEDLPATTDRFVDTLWRGFERNKKIFLCGNGGSAANASHFGQDLAKGTLSSMSAKRRFKVIPLTDNIGFITALANDEGYDSIFEQQLRNLGESGDVLVAISGSGNSPNILRAVEYAKSIGMTTIGVTGYDGGKLRTLADESVHIDIMDMGMCEALHGVVFHAVMCFLRERLSKLG